MLDSTIKDTEEDDDDETRLKNFIKLINVNLKDTDCAMSQLENQIINLEIQKT